VIGRARSWFLLRNFNSIFKIAARECNGNLFVKRSAIFYWLLGIAIAALAIAASFYFDDTVWDFIRQHQNRGVYDFMRKVSRFGDWPLHVALGLLLLGIAWIQGSKKWARVFLAMLIAMALAGFAGNVIKRTVPRARPSVHTDIRWGGPRFSTKYHSFPSGHVAASTAFFGVLFFARRRIGLACFAIPILIGFSRMYIGAHYLSDVVCAAILGIICALIVERLVLSKHQTSNGEH
jgi:membrane-associated phospholipid phosphatase